MFKKEDKTVFDTLFGAISEAVIIVDELQIIRAVNFSTEQMFGYKEGELLNIHLETLIPKKYKQNHGKHFNKFLSAQEKRKMGNGRDLYALHKNSSVFPIEVGLNPLEIDNKKYIMALVIDISLRKHQELEILELNTKLENKVKERTQNLIKTVNKLEKINIELDEENQKRVIAEQKAKEALKKEKELNELKSKFLSLVSHEFKTPLSGILTSSMLLAKYKLTEQQTKREKHLKTINNKVHYLNNILNDFLSIEKLERGEVKYSYNKINIKDIINEAISSASLILKSGQKINLKENINSFYIYQDKKIIDLILSNLLSNAIKYSKENKNIDVRVNQDKNTTIIEVKDKGIGIPEIEQKNIFQRYFRAENSLLIEGTGIGLNIIKNHLENIGGKITFTSKQNTGTTFTIKLPNKI